MKVSVTVRSTEVRTVEASGESYQDAKRAALALVPDGFEVLLIKRDDLPPLA